VRYCCYLSEQIKLQHSYIYGKFSPNVPNAPVFCCGCPNKPVVVGCCCCWLVPKAPPPPNALEPPATNTTVKARMIGCKNIGLTIAKGTECTAWFCLVVLAEGTTTTEDARACARSRLLLLLAESTKARAWLLLILTERAKEPCASAGASAGGSVLTSCVLAEGPKPTACVGVRLGGIVRTKRATAKHRIRNWLRWLAE
jgi:hypothetical protein